MNPYGIVLVAGSPGGLLSASDVLVSNFNNSGNVMGTGTTIVDIRHTQQVSPPFYTTANDDGVNVDPAQPSEIVEFAPSAPSGKFVTQLSIDPANSGAFGIGLAIQGVQNLQARLGYADDNTATFSLLSLYF